MNIEGRRLNTSNQWAFGPHKKVAQKGNTIASCKWEDDVEIYKYSRGGAKEGNPIHSTKINIAQVNPD